MTVAYYTHHMDCIEYLKEIDDASVDVAPLDPPYNTGNKKSKYKNIRKLQEKKWDNFYAEWNDIPNYLEWAEEWLTLLRPKMKPKGGVFIFGTYHNTPEIGIAAKRAGYYIVTHIAYCIPNAMFNAAVTETVHSNQSIYWLRPYKDISHYYDKAAAKRYNNGKNLRDFWLIPNVNERKSPDKPWLNHPSKKNISVIERCIDIAMPKSDWTRVLDLFAGSGTTGEAAMNIARRYGINIHCDQVEKSAEYCDWILKRNDYVCKKTV